MLSVIRVHFPFAVKAQKAPASSVPAHTSINQLHAYENSCYGNGAISMDINYDHFALAELNWMRQENYLIRN